MPPAVGARRRHVSCRPRVSAKMPRARTAETVPVAVAASLTNRERCTTADDPSAVVGVVDSRREHHATGHDAAAVDGEAEHR